MTLQELGERISSWENLHTEFKEWPLRPDELAACIVAFANADGGQLIIGIGENRSIKGVNEPDRVSRDIDNVAWNDCEPPVTVIQEVLSAHEVQPERVIVVNVPKGLLIQLMSERCALEFTLCAILTYNHASPMLVLSQGQAAA